MCVCVCVCVLMLWAFVFMHHAAAIFSRLRSGVTCALGIVEFLHEAIRHVSYKRKSRFGKAVDNSQPRGNSQFLGEGNHRFCLCICCLSHHFKQDVVRCVFMYIYFSFKMLIPIRLGSIASGMVLMQPSSQPNRHWPSV